MANVPADTTLPTADLNAYKDLAAQFIYVATRSGIVTSDKAIAWAKSRAPQGSDSPAVIMNNAGQVLFDENMVVENDPDTGLPAERRIVDDVDPASRAFDVVV